MKRKIWRSIASIVTATMLFSMAVRAAETEDLSGIAAENYQAMSKNDYIDWLLGQMTNEEKCALLAGSNEIASTYGTASATNAIPRLNVGTNVVADGEEGVNTNVEATQLPAKVALAASWSEEMAEEYGQAMGKEAKLLGVGTLLTPRVNIVRDPSSGGNGGNFQTLSEDPFLNGLLGAGEARGIQSEGVIANLKQMFGSSTGSAQGSTASIMNEQTMREVYLQAFDLVIQNAGVGASMTNYSSINNEDMEEKLGQSSTWDWNTILREQMGFDGFIEPDWGRLDGTGCLATGVDWEPTGGSNYGYEAVSAAVEEGTVTWDEVDIAVRNMLTTMYDYGFLSPDYENVDPASYYGGESLISEDVQEESAETAKKAAIEGAVLLKNNNDVLPLSEEDVRKGNVAFIGYTADNLAQPTFKEAASGFYDRKISAIEAIAEKLDIDKEEITYYEGSDLVGESVPAENLKFMDEEGQENTGLSRYTSEQTEDGETVITEQELETNFTRLGEEALAGKTDDGNFASYSYHGLIYAEESGEYRINIVQRFPSDEDYSASGKSMFTGTLNVNGEAVGQSTRLIMNGAANGNSSVATADMGDNYHNWNLCGGYITLEAGQWYDIDFTVNSVYGEDIQYDLTWVTPSEREAQMREAVTGAETANTAVVFIWQDSASQSMDAGTAGGITNLKGGQLEMLQAVAEAYENVIVVCNNGDAFNVSSFADDVDAILEMWWPGQEGGYATAEILLGEESPEGHLPVSFPVSEEQSMARNAEHQERYGSVGGDLADQGSYSYFTEGIDNGYRTYIKNNNEDVIYEFGYGLSYTDFEWSDFQVEANEDGGYNVKVTVTNTGDYAGKDVVQIYLGAPETQPEGIQFSDLTLAGFAKTQELQPGETETVTVEVPELKLSYWDSGETGSLTAEELEEMLNLGGTEAETAKAEAAEWYANHNPDYEGEWRVAEGNRTLYVMTSADWDSEVYSETLQVEAAADIEANSSETVQVPITVTGATALAEINGVVSYDEGMLELTSIEAAEGFSIETDGANFTISSESGDGYDGDVVVGYANFQVVASEEGNTKVSFPATQRNSYDSYGRETYEAVSDVIVGITV